MHTDLFAPTFEERNKEYSVKYRIIQTESDFASLIQQIETSQKISLDLETTGLNPFKDKIVGFSISLCAGSGYYIPIAHRTGEPQLPESLVIEKLKPIFQNPHKTLLLHNGKFDFQFFSRYGIISFGCQIFDSMIAALLLNNQKSVVESFLEAVGVSLRQGKNIEIRGFGRFKLRESKAREARNPKTGEKVHVQAGIKPIFQASRELAARVEMASKTRGAFVTEGQQIA